MSDSDRKSSDRKPPVLLGKSERHNAFYFALSQVDMNCLDQLSSGVEIEVNLGNEIDLYGGNKLVLSDDLIINVVVINDKFVRYDEEKK